MVGVSSQLTGLLLLLLKLSSRLCPSLSPRLHCQLQAC
jgi:hypothetical protein